MRWLWLLNAYWRARHTSFSCRHALEQHQQRVLSSWQQYICNRSPYFSSWRGLPLSQWPFMDKHLMMAEFDSMNTAGIQREAAMALAQRAELTRDFSPTLGKYTVGLSSGTSGQRACFVVSPRERATWAGTILGKVLPNGLRSRERVALFLRANSNLYETVNHPRLTLRFFDLFTAFERHLASLGDYAPTILVAPAQVLRELAIAKLEKRLTICPKRVISTAEVLEPQDRDIITHAFGAPHEIYQATEGFLGSTCEHGIMHLHEENLLVEKEWLDPQRTRFVPIVTDLRRHTQPIVRYRLGDVLRIRPAPCPCGCASIALEAIEGRCDDLLQLPTSEGNVMPIFADVVSRCLAQVLPFQADYQLEQVGLSELVLYAQVTDDQMVMVRNRLEECMRTLGVNTKVLRWNVRTSLPSASSTQKRRRIIRYV